jgi:dTDP-L-rhamnose 4-epimerase
MSTKMKILITGGAGFIGSHISRKLIANGHFVRILDNLSPQIHSVKPDWLSDPDVDFLLGSVSDRSILVEALREIDVVIHLAAETGTGQSMYQIQKYYDVNVMGTAQLFDILTNDECRTVKKVLLASSRSVYGEGAYVCDSDCISGVSRQYPQSRSHKNLSEQRWDHLCESCGNALRSCPTHEFDNISPASMYAASKYSQEDIVRIGSNALSMEYGIFRLQNVYGPGQSLNNPYTGILSIFSTKIKNGKELPIYEDGLESRDFVNVDDVAQVFAIAVEYSGYLSDVVNVGSGVGSSVIDVARHLVSAFKADVPIRVTSNFRLGDIRHNYADIAKLKELFGFQPSVSLGAGISEFIEWVDGQRVHDDNLSLANNELLRRNLMG